MKTEFPSALVFHSHRFIPQLRYENLLPTLFWRLRLGFLFMTWEFPVPVLGDTVSSFQDVRRSLCSYKFDDASPSRLEHLEKERDCPSPSYLTSKADITCQLL